MLNETKINGFQTFTIVADDGISAASFVPEKGACMYSLQMPYLRQARELLYLHDFFWQQQQWHDLAGGIPLLFPICARLKRNNQLGAYAYLGKIYQMPIHGVAWWQAWKVIDDQKDQISFELTANETILKCYPFRFRVVLTYKIKPSAIECSQCYENLDDVPMPYYAGLHPYFKTPMPGAGKEQVLLAFKPTSHFIYNEDLTDIIDQKPACETPIAITAPVLHEALMQVKAEKQVFLKFPDGFCMTMQALGVEEPDMFPFIQLYTMQNKPFFCAEPWMSFPNALNTMSGSRWVKPGESEHAKFILDVGLSQT